MSDDIQISIEEITRIAARLHRLPNKDHVVARANERLKGERKHRRDLAITAAFPEGGRENGG